MVKVVRKPQNKMITIPRNFTKSVVWSRVAVSLTHLIPQVSCITYHLFEAGYLFRQVNLGTQGQRMDSGLPKSQRKGQGRAENTLEEVKIELRETEYRRIRR